MSLLETNNKKFNLPFVFIAGAIFLVVLAFFASYIETLSQEVNSIENTIVSIRIDKDQAIYIDDEKVEIENVVATLEAKFRKSDDLIIQLQSEDISSQRTLEIMEIARNNDYTVILEVSSK
jgi:biopolymer transport protein ExbD